MCNALITEHVLSRRSIVPVHLTDPQVIDSGDASSRRGCWQMDAKQQQPEQFHRGQK